MSRILVTGASGFLGSRLVETLRVKGDQVATHSTQDGSLVEVGPSLEGVDHVYHLAARTFVPESWNHPTEFYAVNVLGTARVLEYCRNQKASFTLLSSYLYGVPNQLPISEDHNLSAPNPYSHSKLLAENIAQYYEKTFGVPVTIVRPFNIYGPGQAQQFLIPTLIQQASRSECDVISVADLRPKRDYIYIDDLVELLLTSHEAGVTGVFNAGSGVSTSVRELAELISDIVGVSKPIRSRDEVRRNEVLDTVADIGKAKTELGWTPKVSLREGLTRTIHSYASSRSRTLGS